MQTFNKIYQYAVTNYGSESALEELLPVPRSLEELKALSDVFCLSNMSRRIFQAGLNRKMIDNKWSAFELVFSGFDIDVVRMMSDEDLEILMQDTRIVPSLGQDPKRQA